MSVNIKENGVVTKLSGLYNNMVGKIKDLADVQVSSPTNGQILQYDGTASKWKNQNMPASGHTYSTTKQAVGTWIDGRTIYEQTFEIEVTEKTSTNNHFYYITITTSDADDFAFINIDAMYQILYDTTIVSSGSVVHHNQFQHIHGYPHTDNNCYAYIQNAELVYNIYQPYAQMVFVVNYYPESTTTLTVSNINAKIYATIQFVESETQEGE